MPNKQYNLLVVAHPDDESIFFTGLLLKKQKSPWKIICVTDANADGQGLKRYEQFRAAMKLLKISDFMFWNFPDIYEKRLPVHTLAAKLKALPKPKEVYTHGIIGEYGHPHHQDISMACHYVFKNVFSVAYNCFPDFSVALTKREYEIKTKILSQIYQEETRRFANFLPAQFTEGFVKISTLEAKNIYDFLTLGTEPPLKNLKKYKWYWPYLQAQKLKALPRPF